MKQTRKKSQESNDSAKVLNNKPVSQLMVTKIKKYIRVAYIIIFEKNLDTTRFSKPT